MEIYFNTLKLPHFLSVSIHLLILVWFLSFLFYLIGYNLLLAYFDLQNAPNLASRSSFKLVSISTWHLLTMGWRSTTESYWSGLFCFFRSKIYSWSVFSILSSSSKISFAYMVKAYRCVVENWSTIFHLRKLNV